MRSLNRFPKFSVKRTIDLRPGSCSMPRVMNSMAPSDPTEAQAVDTLPVSRLNSDYWGIRLDRRKCADRATTHEIPLDSVHSHLQESFVSGELLQRADAPASSHDRHEIAGLDLMIDVPTQSAPHMNHALEREPQIVDDDGNRSRGGSLLRQALR
jgi:hypothetical protein